MATKAKTQPEKKYVPKSINTKLEREKSSAPVVNLNDVRKDYPVIGRRYRHYKGGTYTILTLGNHSETGEPMVVYQSVEFGTITIRPMNNFNAVIKLSDIKIRRFKELPSVINTL